MLPNRTDGYPLSLTDSVLNCGDQVSPFLFIHFFSEQHNLITSVIRAWNCIFF